MNVKELFTRQKEHLDHFFSQLNLEVVERVFEQISQVQGTLFLTGVGKSGYIAQKIAATMMSTGTRSFFLHPIDALHGDLGMVSAHDLLLVFSKSGQTVELLQLLPFIRSRGAPIIAFTSELRSPLSRAADWHLELPCKGELCPFDLAPTSSTQMQLLCGDALAMYLMQKKGFKIEEYAGNHPAGLIGKKSRVRVRDLMLSKERVPICLSSDRLDQVLSDFTQKRCGCLVVVNEKQELLGVFTDGDLRRALERLGDRVLSQSMGNLMTKTPRFIGSEALAMEAMKMMELDQKHPITDLPVVENSQVVGLIKMHDILQSQI